MNLYALTAFAGWAHFVYAWRGQWKSSVRLSSRSRAGYWLLILAIVGILLPVRSWIGVAAFSLLAWVYNIAHFIKAEVYFSRARKIRAAFYSPVLAFAWFTLCLFQVGVLSNPKLIFFGSLTIASIVLVAGGWQLLASGDIRLPLLTMFLLGETLVWAGYAPYMSEAFRVGVYVMHIAAASFYHYLTAYFYAESSAARKSDAALSPAAIAMTNVAVICLGTAVAWLPALRWLRPLAGVEWFTLWVVLHLAASDLMPWWKQRAGSGPSSLRLAAKS